MFSVTTFEKFQASLEDVSPIPPVPVTNNVPPPPNSWLKFSLKTKDVAAGEKQMLNSDTVLESFIRHNIAYIKIDR